MRKWKRYVSLFFVLQFLACSPLSEHVWAAPSRSIVLRRSATQRGSMTKQVVSKPRAKVSTSAASAQVQPRTLALRNAGVNAKAKLVIPAKINTVTGLSDQELKKLELSGVHKKDWAQRLQWFESKIINQYKAMNKNNVLVVGEQKFLDAFKAATKKHNWNANFTYAAKADSPEINGGWGTI